MPFNIGDVVRIQNPNPFRPASALIRQVLPPTLSVADFQEYVVEYLNFRSEAFRFGVCRESEMQLEATAKVGKETD